MRSTCKPITALVKNQMQVVLKLVVYSMRSTSKPTTVSIYSLSTAGFVEGLISQKQMSLREINSSEQEGSNANLYSSKKMKTKGFTYKIPCCVWFFHSLWKSRITWTCPSNREGGAYWCQ